MLKQNQMIQKRFPTKADAGSKPADVKKIPAPAKDAAKPDAKAKPADVKKIQKRFKTCGYKKGSS